LLVALTLQAALGIWTLLAAAPLPVALLHQAMAMLVLTAATVHAASVSRGSRHSGARSNEAASQSITEFGERTLGA
jgi:cytochrome c oxidase assembly protein subunit 15